MSEPDKDVLLAEFTALRDEIRLMFERRTQQQSIGWTALALLIGASATTSLPELALLAAIFSQVMALDDMRNFHLMIRCGTYIRMFIEPKLPGLRWETINYRVRNYPKPVGSPFHSLSLLSAVQAAPVYLAAVIAGCFTARWWPTDAPRQVLLIGLWFIFAAGIPYTLYAYRQKRRAVEHFEGVYQQYIDREAN